MRFRSFLISARIALVLAVMAGALTSCRGSGTGSLPPLGAGRRTLSVSAASVIQWTRGSAGSPSSIAVSFGTAPAAGDLLIIAFWNNGQSSGAPNTYTPPSGWTLVDQNTSNDYTTYQTFSHVVAAGETNQYVFTPLAAQRVHVWIGADLGGAGGVDRAQNVHMSNASTWTTPSVTPSQANDLAIALQLPYTGSSLTWTNPSGWTLGTGPTSPWRGESLYEALGTTAAVSETSTLSASSNGYSAIILVSPSGTVPPPTPTPPPPTPTPPAPPPGSTPSLAQWSSGNAGAPASITVSFRAAPAVGDLLVVAFWNNGQNNGSPNTYTPPAGWTLADQNTSNEYTTYQTFSHIVGSGESNQYVFTPLAAQREHVWIAADASGAAAVDKALNLHIVSGTVWTTPLAAPSQINELALAFQMPYTGSALTWTNPPGWTAGTGPTPVWRGESLSEPLSTTSAVSETSTLSGSSNGYSAIVLLSAAPAAPSPSPLPATYTDWNTFGDNLQRTNYNPNEASLTAANAPSLHLSWSKDLGAAITAQPVIATNVSIGGRPTNVAYIGTEAGVFYALNADTGATIWSKSLGTVATGCLDLPGGTFGITGTATFVQSAKRVYVADGKDQVHALDMATGAEAAGWPATVTSLFTTNHIYGALSYNSNNGMLYAETGSMCDANTWDGRIVAIDTSNATIAATFLAGSPYNGAGVWGIGGAAIDPATNDVYIATGNTKNGPTEYSAYGDQVVHLTSNLSVVAANYPGLTGTDEDFGATPMVYTPPGCAQEVNAKNKSGVFVTYFTSSIGAGPLQILNMAPVTEAGIFIGSTAYSPVTNLVYVGDPAGNTTYTHGLVALAPQADCTLALGWQQTIGPAAVNDDNYSATVANGVVYFTDGIGDQVFAFDAATGQQLWNSGATITGQTQVAPTVDGRVFVSSWDHKLYAFGL